MPNLDSGGAGVRLHISPTGLAIVKAFESCLDPMKGRPGFFKPYVDPVGVLTIGWGHTNHHEPKFTSSSVWSQQQCDDALAGVMATFEAHVAKQAKVPLTQYEFDALVSWSYNTGGPETATLWRKLNAGDKASVPSELAKWNRGGGKVLNGLTRRRKSEGELFAGNVAAALKTAGAKAPVAEPRPQVVAPPLVPDPEPVKPPPTPPKPSAAPLPTTWSAFLMSWLKRK
jgi:lysozyme